MPAKFKLSILVLLFAHLLYGQGGYSDPKLSVEVLPTSLIDMDGGPAGSQLGAEVRLYDRFAVYIGGGGYYGLNGKDWLTSVFNWAGRLSDVKGYIARAELKCYLNSGDYISVEGFYKRQQFNWQDSIQLTPPYLTTFRDFKTVYCFNVKYGTVFEWGSNFIIDIYAGIGIRNRNVTSTLTPKEAAALRYSNDFSYDSSDAGGMANVGDYITPNITLGARIGYIIR